MHIRMNLYYLNEGWYYIKNVRDIWLILGWDIWMKKTYMYLNHQWTTTFQLKFKDYRGKVSVSLKQNDIIKVIFFVSLSLWIVLYFESFKYHILGEYFNKALVSSITWVTHEEGIAVFAQMKVSHLVEGEFQVNIQCSDP